MTNSEARKRKMGEPPTEHGIAAAEIGKEIDEWFIENQDFLLKLPSDEAIRLVAWNMGLIVGSHASR